MKKMSTSDKMQGYAGIFLGAAALLAGALDAILGTDFAKNGEYSLILLGTISTLVGIDRFTFMKRIEDRLDTIDETKEFRDLSGKARTTVSHELLKYVKYHNNKPDYNKGFIKLADDIMKLQSDQLSELVSGQINVSGSEALRIQNLLLDTFSDRFDAVSDRDIDFWLGAPDPEGKDAIGREYFKQNYNALQRNNTSCSRIFIFTENDLVNRKQDIVKVLLEHTVHGIGWGVAIYERLVYDVANPKGHLDFALFDHEKALTYFREHRDTRRFRVVFNIKDNSNEAIIDQQIDLYRDLIAECWIVSKIFSENFEDAVDDEHAIKIIRNKTTRSNLALQKQLGSDFKTENPVFVYVVNTPDEITSKIELLTSVLARTSQIT